MQTPAVRKTLLGKLVDHWEQKYPDYRVWRDWNEILNATTDLPGAKGRRVSSSALESLEGSMSQLRI